IYAIVGSLWILTSDWVVANVFQMHLAATAQTVKGLLYVAVTAALIYWLTRLATRQLAHAETRFRTLFDKAPEPLFLLDKQQHVRQANQAAADMYGFAPRNLVRLRAADIVHPDMRANISDRLARSMRDHTWFESRHVRADGTDFPVEVQVREVEIDGRQMMFGSVHDVSSRYEAEQALRVSEERLRLALDAAEMGMWVWDVPVNDVEWSDGVARIFGIEPGEFEKTYESFLKRVHEGDQERVDTRVRTVLEDREFTEYQEEFRIAWPDGTVRWIELRGRIDRDQAGAPTTFAGIVLDTTERNKAAEALRESEERYRTYVDVAPIAIILLSKDGHILDANSAATRMFGYTIEELHAHTVFELDVSESSAPAAEAFAMLQEKGELRSERRIQCKDNDYRVVDLNAVLLGNGQVLGCAIDITERRVLEDQLRKAQKMEAVGQLAGGVAHDFNNILQAISGYTDLLLSDAPEGSSNREMLSEIANASQRAGRLVSQLLAFSRRQVMRPETLDLNEVIAALTGMLSRIIPESIKVDFVPGHALGWVQADRGMIEQLVTNLCVNARDAMPEGGKLTIETEMVYVDGDYKKAHAWARVGRYVLLSVTDTGKGMDKATLDHIFEPFFTTKAVGKGTGLGLATVYGIVKQHDGIINAYSEPGQGTTFKVYLPLSERSAIDVGTKVEGRAVGGTETILLAEDDEAVRGLAERVLTRAGYTVLTAEDGKRALEVFQAHKDTVDALLVDVVMPGLSGRGVLEEIRKTKPDIPVVFASGYSENVVHTNFVVKAGIRLVQKPFSHDALLRAIRGAIDEKKGAGE
ncbi:PAS domain S-box protein, partial [candidate division GN15 bacterium]|nr:PAS domain S-box protein [candidate division GN15 bacterium]